MANSIILRTALLTCIILGLLFAITATAGKEWQVYVNERGDEYTIGLWQACLKILGKTTCYTISTRFQTLIGKLFFFITHFHYSFH